MVVLLLLLSLIVLACGCSLCKKSPSTWHAHKLCMPHQWLWWRHLLGTTTIVIDVVVVVDVMSLVNVAVVVGCCRIVVVVVVVVNIEETCDVTCHMKLMINKHRHMDASHHVM